MRDKVKLHILFHFKGRNKHSLLTNWSDSNKACWFCESSNRSCYCLLDLLLRSQLGFTWLYWHQSKAKVSRYLFPWPITQGLKSVWTCPFQHLSALQRLLPAFKRATLPSSFTLQGTCRRMKQFALLLSEWICIKFLGTSAFDNKSKTFMVCS